MWVAGGGYVLDAGDGWKGHEGGRWLYSEKEGAYFDVQAM